MTSPSKTVVTPLNKGNIKCKSYFSTIYSTLMKGVGLKLPNYFLSTLITNIRVAWSHGLEPRFLAYFKSSSSKSSAKSVIRGKTR